jgi:hypothetical protein
MFFSKFDHDWEPICQFTFFCHLENYFHLNIIATKDSLKDQNMWSRTFSIKLFKKKEGKFKRQFKKVLCTFLGG